MNSSKNTQLVAVKAQKKVNVQRAKKNANRKKKKRDKNKGETRANAIKDNSSITPVKALVPAQGSIQNIGIQVNFDVLSVQLLPVGLLSMYASRVLTPLMYSIYKVIFADVTSLILSGVGMAPSRFKYMSDILGSLVPKTVPFATYCTVSYKTLSFDTSPQSDLVVHSGTYYMYVPSGSINGFGYQLQIPPPPTTDDQDKSNYMDFLASLAGKEGHTSVVRDVNLSAKYLKDASAFTRVSPYYGVGGGVGAPYSSSELEVPFKSNLLGTFLKFDSSTPRSSQVLTKSSGDSCSNYAIGVLPNFQTPFYNGAVPPMYKFLDIAELGFLLSVTIIEGLKAFYTNNSITDGTVFLNGGFSFSYSQFLLMLRQQVLWMFSDSQSLAQCLSFDTGTNAFCAFLCGSNCYPQEPEVKIRITTVANENLKMLKMAIRRYETKKYENNRNHITQIPVWGAYKNYAPINFTYPNSNGVATQLFANESGNDPNIFDGTIGSDVCDLNDSPVLNQIPAEWNDWMLAMSNVFTALDTMGGDGNGGPLLQFTRYVEYIELDEKVQRPEIVVKEVKRVPQLFKQFIRERKVIERKDSKNKCEVVQHVLAIPDSTVYSEFTQGYSGLIPITSTHKQFFPDLILPIIDISSSDGIPSQTQVQIGVREGHSLEKKLDTSFAGSRASEIQGGVINHVVGLSGRVTALAEFMKELSNRNEGGFIGDLFSAVGSIASTFGI